MIRRAKQQLSFSQKKHEEQKKEHDTIVKHFRIINLRYQILQEKEANKPTLLEHNSEFSLEQKTKNSYFLQTLARERYKFLPPDVKSHIIKLEYEQNTSLQLYIQAFLFNLKSNPYTLVSKLLPKAVLIILFTLLVLTWLNIENCS